MSFISCQKKKMSFIFFLQKKNVWGEKNKKRGEQVCTKKINKKHLARVRTQVAKLKPLVLTCLWVCSKQENPKTLKPSFAFSISLASMADSIFSIQYLKNFISSQIHDDEKWDFNVVNFSLFRILLFDSFFPLILLFRFRFF